MHEFTRRTFIRILGQGSAFLGLGLSSRKILAQEGGAKAQAGKLKTDVVVIGAGPGGLPAALRSAELGLNVCLFEKLNKTGGARNGGMGPFGAGTHIQEKYGIKNCTTKDAFEYLMDFNHWRIDARLASEYINSTAFTVKWLEDQGLSYTPMTGGGGGGAPMMMDENFMHGFARHPDYPDEFFAACSVLTDKAKANKNIRLFLETPVKKLIKTGNAITGVVAQDKNGNEIQVEAKAVIIATGGFSGNPEMIKKYTTYTYNKDLFATFEMPNLSGDGIRMAWDVGAARSEMMMAVYKGIPIYGGPGGTKNEWSILANPNLMVNLQGGRFLNEAMSDRYMMGNAIHRQTNGCGFMMFDSTIADIYRNQKSDTGRGGPPGGGEFAAPINDVDKIVEESKKLNYPYIFAADSLEDFCKQTGIYLDGLKATIAEYNSFCKAGKDPIFYKDASNLMPLYGPKYYASQWCCDQFGGLGGIKINHKTEVLDTALKPIPGLYAGGHDANTMYADTYPAYHSGNFSSFAYTTGLMAAKNSAEYIGGLR